MSPPAAFSHRGKPQTPPSFPLTPVIHTTAPTASELTTVGLCECKSLYYTTMNGPGHTMEFTVIIFRDMLYIRPGLCLALV